MSHHCNQTVRICEPVQAVCCPPQCNPCASPCNPCTVPCNPCAVPCASPCAVPCAVPCGNSCGKGCNKGCNCNKSSNSSRSGSCSSSRNGSCSSSRNSSCSTSKKSHKSDKNDKSDKKSKRCNKCYRHDCDCNEYYQCLRSGCGYVSATLTKTAEPTVFTGAGQGILYIYTLTNTGTVPINGMVQICDDKLGGQILPCVCIAPCQSTTVVRNYVTTADDLLSPSLTNTATAFIQVKRRKWVVTCPASATVTYGDADLFGAIAQTALIGPGANVVVTITNSGASATPAFGVSLTLPFPAGTNSGNVVAGAAIGAASVPVVTATGVTITEATIPIGASYQYQFSYGPVASGAYAWAGTIASASFDPNLANNGVANVINL